MPLKSVLVLDFAELAKLVLFDHRLVSKSSSNSSQRQGLEKTITKLSYLDAGIFKVCSTQATFVLPRSASRRMPPTLAEEIEASEEEESLAESDILLSTSEESDSESDEE